jgi:hypothetical protein
MAGAAGFEPTHDGIKTRCLTAWLRPCSTCVQPLRVVRKERLELSRLAALEPKSSASTNFATSACTGKVSGGYSGNRTCDPSIMSAVL